MVGASSDLQALGDLEGRPCHKSLAEKYVEIANVLKTLSFSFFLCVPHCPYLLLGVCHSSDFVCLIEEITVGVCR